MSEKLSNRFDYRGKLYLLIMFFWFYFSDLIITGHYLGSISYGGKIIAGHLIPQRLFGISFFLYYLYFPISISLILVNVPKTNPYISGFISVLPFSARYFMLVNNINFYPLRKGNFSGLSEYFYYDEKIVLIILFMFFVGVLSYIVADKIHKIDLRNQQE